jgi:hypothetical protein
MKIELHGAYNTGGEGGHMMIRTYSHIKMFSQYFTAPQMFIMDNREKLD